VAVQSFKIGGVLDPHFYFFTNLREHAFEQIKRLFNVTQFRVSTCEDSRGEMLLLCWHAGYHATKELMPWRDFLLLVRRGEFDYLPWLLL